MSCWRTGESWRRKSYTVRERATKRTQAAFYNITAFCFPSKRQITLVKCNKTPSDGDKANLTLLGMISLAECCQLARFVFTVCKVGSCNGNQIILSAGQTQKVIANSLN